MPEDKSASRKLGVTKSTTEESMTAADDVHCSEVDDNIVRAQPGMRL
jgi:hypothetical protein